MNKRCKEKSLKVVKLNNALIKKIILYYVDYSNVIKICCFLITTQKIFHHVMRIKDIL